MPYRICYTSGAAHRALQLGKLMVVSRAVGRSLPTSDRIIQYDDEKEIATALMQVRERDTSPLPPKTSLNFEQPEYRARVQRFYR